MKRMTAVRAMWLVSALISSVPALGAETVPPPPDTQPVSQSTTQVESRIADDFASFAGSNANAESLVRGLRTGTPITLNNGAAGGSTGSTGVVIDTPTRPMGYGNVSISLRLAQQQLASYGITNPSAQQIQAALTGGTVTTASGETVTLNGVLTQRAEGMGWGGIAKAQGTTVGSVMGGAKSGTALPPVPETSTGGTTTGTTTGMTTATGAPVTATTAAGAQSRGSGYGRGAASGSGIVTAAGARPVTSPGIGTGRGMGAEMGRGSGVVTGSGIVTGTGASAAVQGGRGAQTAKGRIK